MRPTIAVVFAYVRDNDSSKIALIPLGRGFVPIDVLAQNGQTTFSLGAIPSVPYDRKSMIYIGYLEVMCPCTCCVCHRHMVVDQMHYYLEGSTYFCSNACMREFIDEAIWLNEKILRDEIYPDYA